MSLLAFSTLRARLLLLVLLAVLPAISLTLYTGHQQRRWAAARAWENALRLTRLAAAQQQQLTDGARQLLFGLAQLPAVHDGDAVACSAVFADLLKQYPVYANLGAITPNGEIFCSAVPLRGPVNVAGRPLESCFQGALKTRAFALGGSHAGLITGRPVTTFASPLLDAGGAVQAVVFAALDLTWLNQFANEAQLPAGSTFMVINGSGLILAHYPDAARWVGQSVTESPFMQKVLQRGEVEALGLDGLSRIFAAFSLPGTTRDADVRVVISIPKEVILTEANRGVLRNLAILGLVALVTFALAWIGSDLLVLRQTNVLMRATERLAAGDLNVRAGIAGGARELRQLAKTFDDMVGALEQQAVERQRAEEALRHNQASLEDAQARVHLGSWEINPVTQRLWWSKEMFCLYGRDPALGSPSFREFLALDPIHPDDRQQIIESYTRILQRGESFSGEHRTNPERGPLRVISTTLHCQKDDQGKVVRLVGTNLDITERQRAEEQIQHSRDQLRALTARLQSIREEERTRIAREIHDELGQALTGLKMDLAWLDRRVANTGDDALRELLLTKTRTMAELIDLIIHTVRRIAADLRPGVLDNLGLLAALEWQAQDFQTRTDIPCRLKTDLEEIKLDPEGTTAVFRIFQEALTNVIRHARATSVEVSVNAQAGRLALAVRDNGKGITESEMAAEESLGLLGMRERVLVLGGEVTIKGEPGQGTTVSVQIPLREEAP